MRIESNAQESVDEILTPEPVRQSRSRKQPREARLMRHDTFFNVAWTLTFGLLAVQFGLIIWMLF